MKNPHHAIEYDGSETFNIKEYPGYLGMFTRDQCSEAKYHNGSRVRKVAGEKDDTHEIGEEATVLGSLGARGIVGYFVEFDSTPRVPTFIIEQKLGAASH